MKMVLETATLILLLLIGSGLMLYLLQSRMIFFPQPTAWANRSDYAANEIHLSHDGITLSGWFFKNQIGPDQPLIVYFGGNAEDVSLNFRDLRRFHTRSFLFMNYRGYGSSQGRPSETTLLSDAVFVWDHLLSNEGIDPEHVILMGRSLGSGVAVHLAAKRTVGGLILVTPFDSLVNVARFHYPFFPVGLLLRHRFDSVRLAPDITAPALFLTAAHDRVVPVRLADNLQRAWGGPVTAIRVDDTDHNTIHASPVYWDAINAFLSSNRGR